MLYETLRRAAPIPRGFSFDLSILRPYFTVFSNRIIQQPDHNKSPKRLTKDSRGPVTYLLLLLFPFNHNLWTFYQPDLFVPINGLLSYLLVQAIFIGRKHIVQREILSSNVNHRMMPFNAMEWSVLCSKVIFITFLLIVLFKIVAFFLDLQVSVVEMAIISLHKYFYLTIGTLITNLLCSGTTSNFILYAFRIYFYASVFLFMARAYKLILHGCGIRRISLYFLMGMVVCELLAVVYFM
ncbi:putative membrane protein [Pseudoloma neurophilia]|uniref:Putative membrane protein n=1 Tax=Pseudoloma neurophilia TaxID=146866 RepID=A0A0R0M7G9_9MICR|nr:putative membrane protein [Pseudoloma neurophilia]